jgi:acyl carrier protein
MNPASKTKLSREEIHQVLWSLAAEHFGHDASALQPGQHVCQDLGADSLDLAEMTMELEEKLGIKIPDAALDNTDPSLGELESAICKELEVE